MVGYAGCQAVEGVEKRASVINRVQLKNLISIRNHQNQVILVNNTFDNNQAVKGVVYID
jgi:hypothetical protein